VIDHHHKKGSDRIENKSRGGTALQGAVDVNVEIERVGGRDSRRRRITAFGRIRATHWQRVIELNEDGTDYVAVGDDVEPLGADGQRLWGDTQTLRKHGPLTAQTFRQLINRSDSVARRRLNALVDAGFAKKSEGELTAQGRGPNVYEAMPSVMSGANETTDATDGLGDVFDV
jgi:hypothetical protein